MQSQNRTVAARLAALGLAVLALAAAGHAQPLSTNQAVAREFATQLTAAPDEEAKVSVLLDIFRWLNIGVYTGDLKQLVRGAERGVMDFYLYDFEVRAIARSLQQGYRWNLDGVHAVMAANSLLPATLDRAFFHDDVRLGMRDALEAPDDPASATALLIAELARRHDPPWDFVLDLKLQEGQLDGLQHFLMLTDLLLPIARQTPPPPAPNQKPASAGLFSLAAGGRHYDETCPTYPELGTQLWKEAKWINRVNRNRPSGGWVKLGEAIRQGLHGIIVAYTVGISRLSPELQSTHYWHGDVPGSPLDFQLKAEVLDDWPELVRCGLLADKPLPRKGEPLPDMKVLWDQGAGGDLNSHGVLMCQNLLPSTAGLDPNAVASALGICVTQTGKDGIASLHFEPKHEPEPNLGMEREERGSLHGTALYQTYFGNWISGVVPQFTTSKEALFAWQVGWHDPSVYRGSIGIEFLGRWDLQRTFPDPESGVRATVTESLAVTNSYRANLNITKVAVFGNTTQVETEYSAVAQISDVYKSNTTGTHYCPATESFVNLTSDTTSDATAAGSKKGVTSPLDFSSDDVRLNFRPDGSYILRIPIPEVTIEGKTDASSSIASACSLIGTKSVSGSEPYSLRPIPITFQAMQDSPNLSVYGSEIEVTGIGQQGEELSGSVEVRAMVRGPSNPSDGTLKIRWKIKPNQV